MFGVLAAVALALAHTAFAFTLGIAAGLLIRRTVPAMAVTFAIFVAIQIIMPTWVRPHLATPARLEIVMTANNVTGSGMRDEPFGPLFLVLDVA